MPRPCGYSAGLLATLFALALPGPVSAQGLTPGNLAVIQVGTGSAALSSDATPIQINQYTITGTPVGSPIIVPSSGAGALTTSGTATSEGFLSRSTDGQFLVFGAYNVPAGTTTPASSTSATVPRVAGRVDAAGTVQFTGLGNSYDGSNIRSAASTNGTDIWTAGNGGSGLGSTAGARYTSFGSGTVTQLSGTTTNLRVINIFNNQLYVTSSTGTFLGVNTFGPGLPTTGGQTLSALPGFPTTGTHSAYGMFALDNPLNPFSGIDTFYLADDSSQANGGGIQRWVFDGSTWNLTGTALTSAGTSVGARGLTATVSGSTVTLYATTNEASANRLGSITDVLTTTSGTFAATGFVTLATAPTNTAFRGVAFTPVPEPASLVAVSLAALVIGRCARGRLGDRSRSFAAAR